MPECLNMKKVVASIILLGILCAPALAQRLKDDDPLMVQERVRKQQIEAVDKQYTRTMGQTRRESDTPVRNDPWSNMRAPNDGKR
jgi:hypothetical protein